MTTQFLDNKIFTFKHFIVMTFPMKNSVLENLPPCTPAQGPLKSAIFIFIVVSLSLKNVEMCRKLFLTLFDAF